MLGNYGPYSEMTDVELGEAMTSWGKRVDSAAGWASAYAAARECRSIKFEADMRGLELENKWVIKVGG